MAIIVGFSETPLGEAAIERAIEEATLRDLPVVLTSHVPLPRREQDTEDYPHRRRETEEKLARAAQTVTERGVRCLAFVPSTPATAAEALLAAADERDGELIIVGIRRRSRVGKAFLGSTAQDVLLGADCPVLGIKVAADVERSA